MSVRIEHVDFDNRMVSLVIGMRDTRERVEAFALQCSSMGFSVTVRLAANLERDKWANLPGNVLVRANEKIPRRRENDPVCVTHDTTREGHLVYRALCSELVPSLRSVGDFAQLCAHALDLDDRTMYRLRLCVSELAANSVHHADYTDRTAMARIEIVARARTLQISYEDNSESFDPSEEPEVNMSEKLDGKHTRGFGLFMLRRIVNSMKFSRKNGWNRITLTINRYAQTATQPTGSR